MMWHIFLFLIGYVRAEIDEANVKELTKVLFDSGLTVFFGRRRKRGVRKIKYRKSEHDEIKKLAAELGIELFSVRFYGVPEIWRRCGKRTGLLLGAVIFTLALIFANDHVWRIEITGNEKVPDEKIIEALRDAGFYLGVNHEKIDFDILHNRFLAASEDIAWIAVNMKGSVAYTEVREYLPDGEEEEDGCANIVAAHDGIITQVSAFAGAPSVAIGDTVKKGQLLISGIVPYEGKETEFVYAKGEVYAEVLRSITVKIPLVNEYKTVDERKISSYGIKFFGKEIFFGGKGRIDSAFYDTITMYNELSVPGCAPLPIALITVEHTPFRYVTETMTEEEAAAKAYAEYKRAFIDATEGVTLLSYDVEGGMSATEDAYVITAALRVIENIAETKEFDIK